MKRKNRIREYWPMSVGECLEVAETDIEFCKAIEKIMGSARGLGNLVVEAARVQATIEEDRRSRRR